MRVIGAPGGAERGKMRVLTYLFTSPPLLSEATMASSNGYRLSYAEVTKGCSSLSVSSDYTGLKMRDGNTGYLSLSLDDGVCYLSGDGAGASNKA